MFNTPLFLLTVPQLIGAVLLFQAIQVALTYVLLRVIKFFA